MNTVSSIESLAASFDEAKHPRNEPAGRDGKESPSDGGKFKSEKGGGSGTASKTEPSDTWKKADYQWPKAMKDWHTFTKDDVLAGKVPGIATVDTLRDGAVAAHARDKAITVSAESQAAFPDGKLSTFLMSHEAGHYIANEIQRENGNMSIPELEPFRAKTKIGYKSPWDDYADPSSYVNEPGEILADTYANLLNSSNTFDEPDSDYAKQRQALLDRVAQTAKKVGLPDKQMWRSKSTQVGNNWVYETVAASADYEADWRKAQRVGHHPDCDGFRIAHRAEVVEERPGLFAAVCAECGNLHTGTFGKDAVTAAARIASEHGNKWVECDLRCREWGTTAAAVDFTSGSMVALFPQFHEAEALAVEGGQPADTLHVTLAFLPSGVEDPKAVARALADMALWVQPLNGDVGGLGMFKPGDDGVPVIALPDVVGLNELRTAVVDVLADSGVEVALQHGFQPHLTLGYGDTAVDDTSLGIPLTFTHVSLVVGPERWDLPLGAAVTAAFDPAKHPRAPKGAKGGGRWVVVKVPGGYAIADSTGQEPFSETPFPKEIQERTAEALNRREEQAGQPRKLIGPDGTVSPSAHIARRTELISEEEAKLAETKGITKDRLSGNQRRSARTMADRRLSSEIEAERAMTAASITVRGNPYHEPAGTRVGGRFARRPGGALPPVPQGWGLGEKYTFRKGQMVGEPGGVEQVATYDLAAREILEGTRDTQQLYGGPMFGYTVDRVVNVQNPIIQHFIGDHAPSDDPTTLFMAGGSGSGKSSILQDLSEDVLPPDAVMVNSDLVKERLPEYDQLKAAGSKATAAAVHEESSDVSKRMLNQANGRGLNAIVDGTGDSAPGNFQKKIDQQVAAGRKVKVVMVDIPTEDAIARADARGHRTGRYVPHDEILRNHQGVAVNHLEWRDTVGDWEVWSNDEGPGGRRVIARRRNGGPIEVLDEARYQQAVDKAENPMRPKRKRGLLGRR